MVVRASSKRILECNSFLDSSFFVPCFFMQEKRHIRGVCRRMGVYTPMLKPLANLVVCVLDPSFRYTAARHRSPSHALLGMAPGRTLGTLFVLPWACACELRRVDKSCSSAQKNRSCRCGTTEQPSNLKSS